MPMHHDVDDAGDALSFHWGCPHTGNDDDNGDDDELPGVHLDDGELGLRERGVPSLVSVADDTAPFCCR